MYSALSAAGMTFKAPGERPLLIGGGLGAPPLLFAAQRLGKKADAVLGFRSKKDILLKDDFEKVCSLKIATDDGSYGFPGSLPLRRQECFLIRNRIPKSAHAALSRCSKRWWRLRKNMISPVKYPSSRGWAAVSAPAFGCACKIKKGGQNTHYQRGLHRRPGF